MNSAIIAALVALPPAIISAILGGWAAVRGKSNESTQLLIAGQQKHMDKLTADYEDQRLRLREVEKVASSLRLEVATCEQDKLRLSMRVAELERKAG